MDCDASAAELPFSGAGWIRIHIYIYEYRYIHICICICMRIQQYLYVHVRGICMSMCICMCMTSRFMILYYRCRSIEPSCSKTNQREPANINTFEANSTAREPQNQNPVGSMWLNLQWGPQGKGPFQTRFSLMHHTSGMLDPYLQYPSEQRLPIDLCFWLAYKGSYAFVLSSRTPETAVSFWLPSKPHKTKWYTHMGYNIYNPQSNAASGAYLLKPPAKQANKSTRGIG